MLRDNKADDSEMKVLVVDDSAEFRRRLKTVVASRYPDAIVVEAGNGDDALRAYALLRPDIVFLDINMPGELNGLIVATRLRHANQDLRIVVVTNHDLPEYRDASLRLGADCFLPKMQVNSATIAGMIQAFRR
jgi:DNA-binding NarL/FixJ family response regulator